MPKKNLRYKPGVLDPAVYLKRPDHNFARGNIPPETVNMTRHNTMRACGDCHDAEKRHAFLPYKAATFRRWPARPATFRPSTSGRTAATTGAS